ANYKCIESSGSQAGNVIASFDTALSDFNHAGRHQLGQLERSIQVNSKSMQVPIVDPNRLAVGVKSTLQLCAIMHLAEHIQIQLGRAPMEVDQFTLSESGDDEQYGIGAMGPRFQQLELVDNEIFPQTGQPGRFLCHLQILQRSLKQPLIV